MAIIRPTNSKDLKYASGAVTRPMSMDVEKSVNSTRIFGSAEMDREDRKSGNQIYCRHGYIELAVPVVNFFLAGMDLAYFHKILPEYAVVDIANGQRIYDLEEGCELQPRSIKQSMVYDPKRYLIGGQYLRYLLDQIDFGELVKEELAELVKEPLKHSVKSKEEKAVLKDAGYTITRGSGMYWVVDDYYVNTEADVNMRQLSYEIEAALQEEFSQHYSLLVVLLALRDHPERLRDQIQDNIFVLPSGFRPDFQKQKDDATKAYDQVVRANNELTKVLNLSHTRLTTVREAYINLVKSIKHATVKNQDPYNERYRSIFDTVKGKKGLIRWLMQGTCVDYSGRSVIIVDPNMSVDTIGVPEAMAEKLVELDVIKASRATSSNKADILCHSREAERKALVKELAEGGYAVIGRQPTLYRLGVQGFKVKIVPGNAIVISPLVTPAFNADFDGDQMHITVPVGDKAKREVECLVASTQNIFLGRSGDSHIAPRQELIYGLWKACKFGIRPDKAGYKHVTIGTGTGWQDDFIDDIIMQRVNIYDSVIFEGEEMSAGIAAIRACLPSDMRNLRLSGKALKALPPKNSPAEVEMWVKGLLPDVVARDSKLADEICKQAVELGVRIPLRTKGKYPWADPTDAYAKFNSGVKDFKEEIDAKGAIVTFDKFVASAKKALKSEVSAECQNNITEGWCKVLMKEIALISKDLFVTTTNRIVKLSFGIAEIFPPSIPIIDCIDEETSTKIKSMISEFQDDVSTRGEYFHRGFEPEITFQSYYAEKYSALEKSVKETIKTSIKSENGYKEMADSGARGNISNLMQVFGMKGRVVKNSVESFNAIIDTSLSEQLTGLQHFITAYGTRQGLVDKSIETYKPGYMSRLMSQACSYISVTCEDCHTTEGLVMDYDFIKQFISSKMLTGDDQLDNGYVRNYLAKILVGRYIVGTDGDGDTEITTIKQAKSMYDKYVATVDSGHFVKKGGIKLRSPLTCASPCCAKCYGRYLGTHMPAAVGLPIGFEAATSIGEPGTQLTMKNFQAGGVAGVKNLTSSFDTMDKYLNLYDLRKSGEPIGYDYLSPGEGAVETVSLGDGTKKLYIKEVKPNGKKGRTIVGGNVLLYDNIKVKEYVELGESIQVEQGQFNMREVMALRGVEYAKKYLATVLYDIFQKEVEVNFKHFEVLVSAMSFYVCTKGNDYFLPGHFYTNVEYMHNDRSDCEFYETIKGVKEVPLVRNDVFSTMFLENIQKGIERSILISGKDEMKLPIVRYSFGLPLQMGAAIDGYVENRGR